MSPASSVNNFISSSWKNSISPAYSASAPTASPETISGKMTIERTPDSAYFLPNRTLESFDESLDTMTCFSLTAIPTMVFDASSLDARPSLMAVRSSSSFPAVATGTILFVFWSTMHTMAMRNSPDATAIRHASSNSSSRSDTRTISALMPLSTAYTRLRYLILASVALRLVMSRMALIARVPSSVSNGLRLTSSGNSVPSLCRPSNSSPAPIARARGCAKKIFSLPACMPRKRSGMSISILCPSSSSRRQPNRSTARELTSTISAAALAITIASGADSNSSLNFCSDFLRSVMS